MPHDADSVQIVKQVRLTPKQRIALMEISNAGGSLGRMDLDHDIATVLMHLGLVEQRSRFTERQKAERIKGRAADWKECAELVRKKDLMGLNRKVDKMRSAIYEDGEKSWFLTPAAKEYLIQGTVTIKRGPEKEEAKSAQ
jgi:hypothetical protein